VPWHWLGALGYLLFWIVAASGIYVYALFDTSVAGAYASVERLSRDPWSVGAIVRSVHRYASDAFVIVVLAHLGREAWLGHYRGFRRFSWLSGAVLLVFVWGSGVVGYWLPWDRVAHYSALRTAEWFDALDLGPPVVRNFLTAGDVTDRLFSLFVFLHIGLPLALLAGMWVHLQRIGHARTVPPRALAAAVLALLVALALARPVRLDAPAHFASLAGKLPLDWFYLFPHPLMEAIGAGGLWALVAALMLALVAPALAAARRAGSARVELGRCTGCARCAQDCPYLAVSVRPRTDGRPFLMQAEVDPARCAGCGICAGACPTAAPLRGGRIAPGIDLPERPVAALEPLLASATLAGRTIVFRCRRSRTRRGAGEIDAVLECIGQLPPTVADAALRAGAALVRLEGCAPAACEYRLGERWTAERLAGRREPHLPAARAARVRAAIAGLGALPLGARRLVAAGVLAAAAATVGFFSQRPGYAALGEGMAEIRILIVHAGERLRPCRRLGEAELAARPPHMRLPEECPRGRAPVPVRVLLAGRTLVDGSFAPRGFAADAPARLYRRYTVPAGRYALEVRIADSPRPGAAVWQRSEAVQLEPGRVLTIDFRPEEGIRLL